MNKFTIEKNVPVPERHGLFGRGLTGAVRQMAVGDSIFVPNGKQTTVSSSGRVISVENKAKFITRMVEGGVRIWRVE